MSVSSVYSENIVVKSTVLKNTFMLLAATFAFSTVMALTSVFLSVPVINPWITLGVYIAILVILHFNANNGLGVLMTFALTGWLGFTVGPILSYVFAVNPMVVVNAFMMATVMLVGLSAYAIFSRKDFSFLGGFLTIGILVAFVASLVALFFKITVLSLIVSAAFVILSGGVILWQVSSIINGGETNYVLATVTLFVSFYNIFISLLNLFGYNSD
jgi:modulator of FtsH protease